MITCREAEDLIARHLDGATAGANQLALADHLAGCDACAQLLQSEQAVDSNLAAIFAGAGPSPQFGPRVLNRIRREASLDQWPWIADALNAVGVLAMIAFGMRFFGDIDPRVAETVAAIVAATVAIGVYPLLLGRIGGDQTIGDRTAEEPPSPAAVMKP